MIKERVRVISIKNKERFVEVVQVIQTMEDEKMLYNKGDSI